MPEQLRHRPEVDRNLLFGILALQMDFISRDALIGAMHAWVLEKTKPLGQILLEQGMLRQDARALLESLVQKHLEMHGGDAEKSLAAVSSIGSTREELKQIADPELHASLAHVSVDRNDQSDPFGTRPGSRETPTSSGLRFRVLRPHARGGLGEVFVALDEELHREVALKEIQGRYADQEGSRARFVFEAEVTGGLEHPGIVPVYGLGSYADGRPFYAMRFIRGDNLKEAIDHFHKRVAGASDFTSLEFRQLLRRFIDVCNAVAYAHSRGVLHRDLKPGNIMLGKYGETLVVDWGLAKVVGHTSQAMDGRGRKGEETLRPSSASGTPETLAGSAVGTPAYMSPEQAAGRLDQLGSLSDVYSLGATLYSVLTGTVPFDGQDPGDLLRRVERGEFLLPCKLKKDAPKALEAVCLKGMALRPADRYSTPLELAQAVEQWLADEPVSGYAEPMLVRAGRFVRKRKALVATAAAALLTSTIGLALGLIFVNAEKNRTELARQDAENQRIAAEQARQDTENQRAAAEKSAQEARSREAETKAVLGFVENKVFAAARPKNENGGLGYDVKLVDAVRAALPFVESSFGGQPLIEARLRMTLGKSFWDLGDAKMAAKQFQAARSLGTTYLGSDHADTIASMSNLAGSYFMLGRYGDAIKLYEETLTLRKARLGPDHPETLDIMNNLAGCYDAVGRHADALKLYEQTLALRKAKLGLDHPDTLMSMTGLGNSYFTLGRYGESVKLREETLALQKAKLGSDNSETLGSMQNLANSYSVLGRNADALKLYEEALALRRNKSGPDHPDTLMTMSNLVMLYPTWPKRRRAQAWRKDSSFRKEQARY